MIKEPSSRTRYMLEVFIHLNTMTIFVYEMNSKIQETFMQDYSFFFFQILRMNKN